MRLRDRDLALRLERLRLETAALLGRDLAEEELLGLLLDYACGDPAAFEAWAHRQGCTPS